LPKLSKITEWPCFTELGAKRLRKLLTTRYGYVDPSDIEQRADTRWWFTVRRG